MSRFYFEQSEHTVEVTQPRKEKVNRGPAGLGSHVCLDLPDLEVREHPLLEELARWKEVVVQMGHEMRNSI